MSSLRRMKATDLMAFTSVNLDPYTETYHLGFYLEYLAKWPHLCYVIDQPDSGKIEGYILGKVEASGGYQRPTAEPYSPDTNKNKNYLPWHAHITALSVVPERRRMGHARKLTEALEVQGDIQNAWFVDLYVRADNVKALKLYESMGYSIYRQVKDYYADGEDAYDMRKPLSRDKDRKHVHKEGEKYFAVDPSEVCKTLETSLKAHTTQAAWPELQTATHTLMLIQTTQLIQDLLHRLDNTVSTSSPSAQISKKVSSRLTILSLRLNISSPPKAKIEQEQEISNKEDDEDLTLKQLISVTTGLNNEEMRQADVTEDVHDFVHCTKKGFLFSRLNPNVEGWGLWDMWGCDCDEKEKQKEEREKEKEKREERDEEVEGSVLCTE